MGDEPRQSIPREQVHLRRVRLPVGVVLGVRSAIEREVQGRRSQAEEGGRAAGDVESARAHAEEVDVLVPCGHVVRNTEVEVVIPGVPLTVYETRMGSACESFAATEYVTRNAKPKISRFIVALRS